VCIVAVQCTQICTRCAPRHDGIAVALIQELGEPYIIEIAYLLVAEEEKSQSVPYTVYGGFSNLGGSRCHAARSTGLRKLPR
jgi:hypothetical protein